MIDLAVLYNVLRGMAMSKGIISHENLSRLYHEPQEETWNGPLDQLNGPAWRPGCRRSRLG